MPKHPLPFGLADSLEQFFTTSEVPRKKALALEGLRGEVIAFQLVYRSKENGGEISVDIEGPLAECTTQRRVGLVPVEYPTETEPDGRIGLAPGFYPDPLLNETTYPRYADQTRAAWFTIRIPKTANAGKSVLGLTLRDGNGKKLGAARVTVNVIPAELPEQTLNVIHWFHNDCLLSWYKVDVWSREHWQILKPYLRDAAEHGTNTITTPMFTPPLDTAVGTERPTVQLVDVEVIGKDQYKFGFKRFAKWINLCRRCGMTHFELSHLATQWGAEHAPKIVARVDGEEKRIFGWKDSSYGRRYKRFLLQFLPQLVAFLRSKRVLNKCYLHVSDEPSVAHLETYRKVREILRRGAPELPVIDALSNIDFYDTGLVDFPIAATNHAAPFIERPVPHFWCYYCCGQREGVSNRFIDFPSWRNRILGWQLYKYRAEGFLQWGYNYWYRQLTDELVNPYWHVHSARPLPAGDAFVVYPGENGPVDSLRWEVFRESLQDMRALQLLEALVAEKPNRAAEKLLALDEIQSMAVYPRNGDWIRSMRRKVNGAIAKLIG